MNIVPFQLAIRRGGLVTVSSENNLEFLNRQKAPEGRVKWEIKKNKKRKQENQRTELNMSAHTTLRCCVALLTGNSQKTGVLGARPVSRCRSKALLGPPSAYRAILLSCYINGLISRRPLAPTSSQER
jgi:hypothetical protein